MGWKADRLDRDELMYEARQIALQYGGNLTVRQLYYRLVATGKIHSKQSEYQRLVAGLSAHRMRGLFPFEWLLDRTRESRPGSYGFDRTNVDDAMGQAAGVIRSLPEELINRARWRGQPTHVSVWVEKEALAGMFEQPCNSLGVSWFVCRGYPSLSSLYEWTLQVEQAVERDRAIEDVVVLYFGDHDPDGFEIPRSAIRNIEEIIRLERLDIPTPRLERVALSIDQIRAFDPPPFPAKRTSSRYQKYYDEHGVNDAWELDALEPDVLVRLIRDEVRALFDADVYSKNREEVHLARRQMRNRMNDAEWLNSIFNG